MSIVLLTACVVQCNHCCRYLNRADAIRPTPCLANARHFATIPTAIRFATKYAWTIRPDYSCCPTCTPSKPA